MKRVIWIVVILAVVGYFINNYLEDRAKKKAEELERRRIELATKSAVSQMVSRYNAS